MRYDFLMKCYLIITLAMISQLTSAVGPKEYVILLHGLCRSGRSMIPMGQALTHAGYQVVNVEYPSRSRSIEKLSEDAIGVALISSRTRSAGFWFAVIYHVTKFPISVVWSCWVRLIKAVKWWTNWVRGGCSK
jgi:hypothetical protein